MVAVIQASSRYCGSISTKRTHRCIHSSLKKNKNKKTLLIGAIAPLTNRGIKTKSSRTVSENS
jgi:hypothetical protein